MLGLCRGRKFSGAGAFHAYFNRTGSFIFSRGGNIAIDLSLLVWLLPPNRQGQSKRCRELAKTINNAAAGRCEKMPLANKRLVKALHWGAMHANTDAVGSGKRQTRSETDRRHKERVKKHRCAAGPSERQYTQTQTLWAVSSAKHGMKRIKGTKREPKSTGVRLAGPNGLVI